MAEISVPAWPIPIHQTKLMIGNAQPTGWLVPQMPIPFATSQTIVNSSSCATMNAIAKPMNQWNGVRFFSVTSPILSLTLPNVWSPSTIAG